MSAALREQSFAPPGAIMLQPQATIPVDPGTEFIAYAATTWATAAETRDWIRGMGYETSVQSRGLEAFGVKSMLWYVVGIKEVSDGVA